MKKPNLYHINNLFFPTVLTLIVLVLFATNYIPGTWLSGWDTLHPEFNFSLYFERIIQGSWQEHQGVGAPPAQSHIAELPRAILLYLISLFVTASSVRYIFFFLSLGTGALGMYWLVLKHVVSSGNTVRKQGISFITALFYLLNLTVVQQFVVPLEMFAVHYATLPWIVGLTISYLKTGQRRNLLLLSTTFILAASMSHTATLFYSFFVLYIASLAIWTLASRFSKTSIQRSIVVILVCLVMNLFWLLPNFYFIANHSKEVELSKIHTNFSDEAFLQSRSFGTLRDLSLHKNFLFNWQVYNYDKQQFDPLLSEWNEYVEEQFSVRLLYYLVFVIALLGSVLSVIKRQKVGVFVLPMVVVSGIFLINQNFPFTAIFDFLRSNISLFREALRFPFTKFSILYLFSLAVVFAIGFEFILGYVKKIKGLFLMIGFLTVWIIFSAGPAFQGVLVHPEVKVNIPSEYFEAFEWFESQPQEARVAKLPMHSFWGWNYHSWGYQGAGFTWFGIKQPTLDREFDRWSPYNETFYNEISSALYNGEQEDFIKVLKKYDVKYLFWDRSIINAGGSDEILASQRIENYLSSEEFTRVKDFGDVITIYSFNNEPSDFVSAPSAYKETNVSSLYNLQDFVFDTEISYINSKGARYPFANLNDKKNGLSIKVSQDRINIGASIGDVNENTLNIPAFTSERDMVTATVMGRLTSDNELITYLEYNLPRILVDGKIVYEPAATSEEVSLQLDDDINSSLILVDNQIVNVDGITNEFTKLGEISIEDKETISIAQFSLQQGSGDDIVTKLFENNPRECANPDQLFSLDADTRSNTFTLFTSPKGVCFGTDFVVNEPTLVDITFETSNQDEISPFVCITSKDVPGCVDGTILEQGEYWIDFLARESGDSIQKITYRNLVISLYSKVNETSLQHKQTLVDAQSLSLPTKPSKVDVLIPKSVIADEEWSENRGYSSEHNCNSLGEGQVIKNIYHDSVFLGAYNKGVSCNYYEFSSVPHNGGVFLRFLGKNQDGRSLKVYVYNPVSKRFDIEQVMPEGHYDKMMTLPASYDHGLGYTVNIESRSFGRIGSENEVYAMEFIHYPNNWLRNVSIGTAEQHVNHVNIEQYTRHNATYYHLKNISGSGLLTLSQSYEPGWIAYSQEEGILQHVVADGWKNGWIVDGRSNEIIIYYLPQLLVYLGLATTFSVYLLFLITFILKKLQK